MLTKTITYVDYNGNERTEDFYFNLTQAEVLEMELGVVGGYTAMIEQITKADDVPTLASVFKELILKAYGERTPDGKHFVKIDNAGIPLSRAFSQTEAFSVLYMELALDSKAGAAFVNGIMPKGMDKVIEEAMKKRASENA